MKKINICMALLFLALSLSLSVSAADKTDIKINGVHTTNNPTVSDVDQHTIEINKSIEKIKANQYVDVKLTVKSIDMKVPKTGDSDIVVPIVLLLISSCGLVVLARKKSHKSMLSILLVLALLPALSSNAITVQAKTMDSTYTTIETFSDEMFESFTFDKVISTSTGTNYVAKNNEGKITAIKWNVPDANTKQSLVYRLLLNDTVQDNLIGKKINVSSAYLNFTDSGSKVTKIAYPDVSIKLTTSESTPPATAFTVAYDANGGIGSHADADISSGTSYTVKSPDDVGIIGLPGAIFANWNTASNGSGTSYSPGDIINITSNVTLYAIWIDTPASAFTVTYDANGGTGSHADADILSGASYTVKSPGNVGISSATFIFNNWNTAPDGSGTPYSAGQPITVTSDMTLYAQWYAVPPMSFTVTYDANGQNGSHMDTDITSGTSYTVKSAANIGINSATLSFIGWNTASNGSGTSYSPGAIISITNDVTLYARWGIAPEN